MPLEIDHIYSFCDSSLPEVARLENHGLTLTAGRTHRGQGTANRCVMFEENYFELIYLASEHEARSNPLRLDRRADWRTTGASPFGIALRGQLAEEDREKFWAYHPPYAPGMVIWIHEANEKNPELPMIFVMEFPSNVAIEDLKPRHRFPEKQLLKHSLGTTRIESLIAFGPGLRWPLAEEVEGVRFEASPRPHLHLHIDARRKINFAMNDLCSFANP